MNSTATKNPAVASADPITSSLAAMTRRIVFENAGAMLFDIGLPNAAPSASAAPPNALVDRI